MKISAQIKTARDAIGPEMKESGDSRKTMVQYYMENVRGHRLVSRSTERDLAERIHIHADRQAANLLVTANLRLVVKIAIGYMRSWKIPEQQLSDLIQEGNIGLVRAVWKYDPRKNTKFSYYASFWIKSYMIKFIMENWSIVKIGTSQAQKKFFFNLAREKQNLIRNGIDPDPGMLGKHMGASEKDVYWMEQRLGGRDLSLNSRVGDDGDTERIDFLRDDSDSPEERVCRDQTMKVLREKIFEFKQNLSRRENEIFEKRIYSDTPQTLQELGDMFGISRERVRQLEKTIHEKAREFFSQVTVAMNPEPHINRVECWI